MTSRINEKRNNQDLDGQKNKNDNNNNNGNNDNRKNNNDGNRKNDGNNNNNNDGNRNNDGKNNNNNNSNRNNDGKNNNNNNNNRNNDGKNNNNDGNRNNDGNNNNNKNRNGTPNDDVIIIDQNHQIPSNHIPILVPLPLPEPIPVPGLPPTTADPIPVPELPPTTAETRPIDHPSPPLPKVIPQQPEVLPKKIINSVLNVLPQVNGQTPVDINTAKIQIDSKIVPTGVTGPNVGVQVAIAGSCLIVSVALFMWIRRKMRRSRPEKDGDDENIVFKDTALKLKIQSSKFANFSKADKFSLNSNKQKTNFPPSPPKTKAMYVNNSVISSTESTVTGNFFSDKLEGGSKNLFSRISFSWSAFRGSVASSDARGSSMRGPLKWPSTANSSVVNFDLPAIATRDFRGSSESIGEGTEFSWRDSMVKSLNREDTLKSF